VIALSRPRRPRRRE